MQELISVVIPSFNGEKYIEECILSVKKQHMNTEIIVIDDISTDDTPKIAKSLGCKVLINSIHKGQIAAKNMGVRISKGDYWLTIDQDDILVDGALCRLFEEINKTADYNIVMAKVQDFCSDNIIENKKYCKSEPYFGILTGAVLFKKEVFNKIGLWYEKSSTGDVIDLTNRLFDHGLDIKKIDFVSCLRRIHSNNYGRLHQDLEYKDYAYALRQRIIKKQRAGTNED